MAEVIELLGDASRFDYCATLENHKEKSIAPTGAIWANTCSCLASVAAPPVDLEVLVDLTRFGGGNGLVRSTRELLRHNPIREAFEEPVVIK